MKKLYVMVVFLFLSGSLTAEDIHLSYRGGVYHIPITLNGAVRLEFIIDTGAATVTIPRDLFNTLFRVGTLSKSDFLGGDKSETAFGENIEDLRINIRELTIGSQTIYNVQASVGEDNASLILGQSALKKIEPWSLNTRNKVLTIRSNSLNSTKNNSSYVATDRNLVRDIQSHLKALGYDPGPADGTHGIRTFAAVKAFQREWDIHPDGVLSSTLLKVLKIALAAKSKSDQPANKELSLVGSGTGFTIGSDYVVTNRHVIDNCSKLVVYVNGEPVSGSVAASSDNDDLALIKLTRSSSYQASFRDSGRARLGEDIWVVGYPLRTLLASGLNVVSGEISALAGLGNNSRVMQISAPVQLGNSGGPLLDSSGNVVGVIVSKLDAKKFADAIGDIPQNINFAIKGTVVKSFLDIHGIDYQTASSWAWTEKNGEELAAKAGEFTVPIECYK